MEGTPGESEGEVWTYSTAPERLKYKWEFYFKDAPARVRENIQMDEVGTYSVTDMRSADKTSRLIRDELRRISGLAGMKGSIIDGSACVGGNTISFAKHFEKVTAYEISGTRCQMLRHNLALFNVVEKVNVIQGDFVGAIQNF